MANTLLSISKITRESLAILSNNLAFLGAVNREYSDEFKNKGAQIGATLNVRKPPRYVVKHGPALQLQDTTETYIPVRIHDQAQISVAVTTADMTLHINDFAKLHLMPAMTSIINDIEYGMLKLLYPQVYNHVGVVGTPPATAAAVLAASQRLNEEAAPYDGMRAFIVNPQAQASLVGGLTNLFNPQSVISRQFTSGKMGDDVLGFNFAMDQNIPVHTYGTQVTASNITTSGAQAGLTDPTTDATTSFTLTVAATAGTITKGTVISSTAIQAVNPQNRQSTQQPRQFVVTADAAAGATSLQIFPAPIFSGAFQNVTSSSGNIPNGTVFTVPNASAGTVAAQNLAFHPNAFTLATADLDMPSGGVEGYQKAYKGINLRVLKFYGQAGDQQVLRFDVLWGAALVYPELATRVTS